MILYNIKLIIIKQGCKVKVMIANYSTFETEIEKEI